MQEPVLSHECLVEADIGGRGRVEAELLLLARHLDVGAVDDERADTPRPRRRRVRAGEDDERAGVAAVRDPLLRAAQLPAGAVGDSLGAQRSGVRSGIGLGECEGPDHAPGGEIGDESALLLVGPEGEDRERRGARVHGDGDADSRIRAGELLEHEDVREKVGAGTSELLGHADAHQPELAQLGEHLPREGVPAIPAGRVWRDLGVRELTGESLDGALLGGEREVHQAASIVGAMRRPPAFVLLLLLFAVGLSGCGGDGTKDPTKVVESWSQAINASDDETAAGLFAAGCGRDPGRPPHDAKGEAEALAFNSSLPCGGKIVKTSIDG